jgi:hypothetical protein
MPENDIIIVAGGGGMKKGALTWLKQAVQRNLYLAESTTQKNIQVFSIDEFLRWANRTLR